MLASVKHTPALRLEILQQQIREAGEWDARPAALRRFRWLREAGAIMAESKEQAEACIKDAEVFTSTANKFAGMSGEAGLREDAEAWLDVAVENWGAYASAADLIIVLVSGDDATADLDLIETLLQGEG